MRSPFRIVLWSGALGVIFLLATPVMGADTKDLDRLETVIKEQQSQIEAQQDALETLSRQVDELKNQADAKNEPTTVTTLASKTAVKIYGQINKAVLISNDGHDTDTYLVDNDNSSTRIGLEASLVPNERYTIGTKMEFEYQTNPSNEVSQRESRVDDPGFKRRYLDLWVDAGIYGRLSLGWGSTASDGVAEVDLSGTSLVGYSGVSDMAGGQLFYDNDAGGLSSASVEGVFSNMDGLGRDERIRYDSPIINGLGGSVSYVNGGGKDLAVRYNTKISDYKLAAATAFCVADDTSETIDQQLSGSFSVLHNLGFNVTMAMGLREHKQADHSDGGFWYMKFGYRHRWCPLGETSLSIDFGQYYDIGEDGDQADTLGFQMVQNLETWNTDVFLGSRFYSLDRNGTDCDDINALMAGVRFKF